MHYPVRQIAAMTLSVLLTLTILACGSTTGPEDASSAKSNTILITPQKVDLQPAQAVKFTAKVLNKAGNGVSAEVRWYATGGTISPDGRYVAGNRSGSFWVVAEKGASVGRASVNIKTSTSSSDPVPTTIEISPRQAEMSFGETRQFSAAVRDQNGNRMTATVSWKATGGVVTSSGSYTAGSTAGTYKVTAMSGTLSASASVTIASTSSTPSPPPPSGAIEVYPGQSIQAAVDRASQGATFLIKTGVHRRQSVRPKHGMTFVGESGTILDGENTVAYAFFGQETSSAPAVDYVTIRNLEIRNYLSELQMGAIRGGAYTAESETSGWVIEGCNIHHNKSGGIRIGHRMIVRDNNIHHNGQIGIVGVGDNVLVENNEIAFNHTLGSGNTIGEKGGTKFVKTHNLVVRGNYVHDNYGPGLWMDIDNIDALVENNRVVNNDDNGIFYEISYGAIIRNNHVEGNGFEDMRWLYGAGIFVSASPDVEIYGNTVKNNAHGITAVQQNRGSGVLGPHKVKNLWVHDNSITQNGNYAAGLGQDNGDVEVFTTWNNRFDENQYVIGSTPTFLHWKDAWSTWSEWRAQGQDLNGTWTR